MRLTAALTIILLVAVMGVAAVQDIRPNRKVLQDTAPGPASETMTTAPDAMNTTSAEAMSNMTGSMNTTNATMNATDERSRFAGSSTAPLEGCRLIECKKRKLLQTLEATATNETQAAGAEGANATMGAAAVNMTASGNATGNGTDDRSRRGGRGGGGGDGWGGSRGSSPYGDRTSFGV